MSRAAPAPLDRSPAVAQMWAQTRRGLWARFAAWDYAQTNDQQISEDEPQFQALIAAGARLEVDSPARVAQILALAEAGSVWAMARAGAVFHRGSGVPCDLERAEHWYRRACEAGSLRALLDLGRLLAGRGDEAGAELVFRRGAADDWPPALFWLAWFQIKRAASAQQRRRSLPLLERAAAKGSPAAAWLLAWGQAGGRFGLRAIPRGLRMILTPRAPRPVGGDHRQATAIHTSWSDEAGRARIDRVLRVLDRLLAAVGDPRRRHVHHLRAALDETEAAFEGLYASATWWGGAGSMCDVWLSDEIASRDYHRALVELVEAAEALGVRCGPARGQAGLLRAISR